MISRAVEEFGSLPYYVPPASSPARLPLAPFGAQMNPNSYSTKWIGLDKRSRVRFASSESIARFHDTGRLIVCNPATLPRKLPPAQRVRHGDFSAKWLLNCEP